MANTPAQPILLLTTEPLPLPGCDTTGAGLRAWALAEGLRAHGIRVVVGTPRYPDMEMPDPLPEGVATFTRGNAGAMVAEVNPLAVVLQHWGMAKEVPELAVPLAIDLAGPHLLERAFWGSSNLDADLTEKLSALRRADFVVCSGQFQRHYFMPFLAMAGFDPKSIDLPVIPFSVAPASPASVPAPSEPDFIYAGTALAWQDPSNPIRWLLDEMDRSGRGTLTHITGSHPVLDASGGFDPNFRRLLENHPRVRRRDRMPFDQLMPVLAGATAALDLMERNLERELAYASRTMVYLRAGLPVIHNNYAETAAVIAAHNAGWTLDPRDESGFRRVVAGILSGSENLDAKRRGAAQAANAHRWDATIEPLAAWCANPQFRDGKTATVLAFEARNTRVVALENRLEILERELSTLRGKLVVRIARRMGGFGSILRPIAYLAAWPAAALVYWRLRAGCRKA